MPTKYSLSITVRSSSRAPTTSWLLLTGSTAASWWSGSRPPGGRSEETQSKKYEKKLVSAIDRYELLRLSSVSGNKVVAISTRHIPLPTCSSFESKPAAGPKTLRVDLTKTPG